MTTALKKLAVFKFSSCDGCQLSVLDLEDELLALAGKIDIAHFLEASSATKDGPYDVTLVEGSITTPDEAKRILDVRAQSRTLITIGACATAGGIQALRNFASLEEYKNLVYAQPEYIDSLAMVEPISALVKVDYELQGCPVNKYQLLEVLLAFLQERRPNITSKAVCHECKLAGAPCLPVVRGEPCLGPITQGGCGALCPKYDRGCYGCFGPKENANPESLSAWWKNNGVPREERVRLLRSFNAWASPFREVSQKNENEND